MSSHLKNLSFYKNNIPSAENMSFGIVVSKWHEEITNELFKGTYSTLLKYGADEENIITITVPGSFELVHGAKIMADNYDVDAIICIGCIIKGETPHFDYICQGVTHGIAELNAKGYIPVIFGVLTTKNLKQASDRSIGKYGNKGDEAAVTAIRMAHIAAENYLPMDGDEEEGLLDPDDIYFN